MGGSLCFLFVSLLVLVGLVTETGGSGFQPVLSGPSRAYLRSTVQFSCEVPGWSSPLTYELRKDEGDLVATEVNIMAMFSLKVREVSEGKYYCRLTTGGQTSNTVQLQVVIPVQGASLSSEPDPPIIYEGDSLTLHCLTRRGTHLSFTWYHNKQEVTSPSELYQLSENTLTVDRASEQHSGIYSCTAQNEMNVNTRYSSSPNLDVFVKKYISAPRLTYTVFCNGSALLANISCRLDRGSPPVRFFMLLDGVQMEEKQVTGLETWFLLPVAVGLNRGAAQCKAETEIQQLVSDPVALEVVPVGGAVEVMVTYFHNADAVVTAARLKCVPGRGTFPAFSWSLNHSSVPAEGDSHALLQHGQILVLLDIDAASSGLYRCAVRDSFDNNSTWVESSGILMQKMDFGATSMEVMALVFCGFLSLVIVGGTVCILLNSNRGNEHSSKPQISQELNQSETILNTGLQSADSACQTQTLEMKTMVMEFDV